MNVLVDTCVWSLALRRQNDHSTVYVDELKELIMSGRAQMIGPIRQEILSGIKLQKQFETLKRELTAFPDIKIQTADYEYAAEIYNLLQTKGIQGSNIDFLICAIAIRCNLKIFTVDKDFLFFSKHLPIELYLNLK